MGRKKAEATGDASPVVKETAPPSLGSQVLKSILRMERHEAYRLFRDCMVAYHKKGVFAVVRVPVKGHADVEACARGVIDAIIRSGALLPMEDADLIRGLDVREPFVPVEAPVVRSELLERDRRRRALEIEGLREIIKLNALRVPRGKTPAGVDPDEHALGVLRRVVEDFESNRRYLSNCHLHRP